MIQTGVNRTRKEGKRPKGTISGPEKSVKALGLTESKVIFSKKKEKAT